MSAMHVVFCTCPNDQVARDLAAGLVEKRLAACVNVLPAIRSIYRWQGEVREDTETLMVAKTSLAAYPALESWLTQAHPYDVPEIIAVNVERGWPAYLDWVANETAAPGET